VRLQQFIFVGKGLAFSKPIDAAGGTNSAQVKV